VVTRNVITRPAAKAKERMTINLSDKTDDELIAEAQSGQERSQMVAVEVARRLRNSIDALRQSTDKYSLLLVWLTGVLTVLTAVLVYKAFRP
jgi:hypothetical protein